MHTASLTGHSSVYYTETAIIAVYVTLALNQGRGPFELEDRNFLFMYCEESMIQRMKAVPKQTLYESSKYGSKLKFSMLQRAK